jgi:hypothetical protein
LCGGLGEGELGIQTDDGEDEDNDERLHIEKNNKPKTGGKSRTKDDGWWMMVPVISHQSSVISTFQVTWVTRVMVKAGNRSSVIGYWTLMTGYCPSSPLPCSLAGLTGGWFLFLHGI